MLRHLLNSAIDAWSIVTPKKKRLLPLAFILILISTVFDIFGIVSLVPIIAGGLIETNELDWFLPNFFGEMSHNQRLWLVVGILLCRLFTQSMITYFLAYFSFGLGAELKSELARKYIISKGGGHNLTATELMASGQKLIEDFTQGYVLSFLTALNNLMIMFFAVGSIVLVAPASILWLIGSVSVGVGCYLAVSSRFINYFGILSTKATLSQASTLNDLSLGYKTIVGSGLASFFFKRYSLTTQQYANALTKSLIARGIPRYLFELLFALLLIGFFGISSSNDATPMIEVGILVLAARILPVITTLSNSILNFVHVIPVISELKRLFFAVEYEHSKKKVTRSSFVSENKKLILRAEHIAPVRNDTVLFDPINFQLTAGHWIAIKGRSGIGKTSLMDLIAGVDDRGVGEIVVEYQSDVDLLDERDIAYISQDTFIMDGNVSTNLSAGAKNFNDYKMLLKFGFEVDENDLLKQPGRTLSGGEKQRVAICRAIFGGARILIMDEPISAINHKLAKQVMEFMKSYDELSLIMVIHGDDFDMYFDEIIDLRCTGS